LRDRQEQLVKNSNGYVRNLVGKQSDLRESGLEISLQNLRFIKERRANKRFARI